LPRKKGKSYSQGELNKLVDAAMHPLTRNDLTFWLVDGILHGIVEQNPDVSAKKFVKYDVPKIIQQVTGLRLEKKRRKPRKKFQSASCNKQGARSFDTPSSSNLTMSLENCSRRH
jgi:hypothetical protein